MAVSLAEHLSVSELMSELMKWSEWRLGHAGRCLSIGSAIGIEQMDSMDFKFAADVFAKKP